MKLKRFCAIVISLAMVLSIVPAFSLTASAASTTGVIDELGATVLWSAPTGSYYDTAIADAFDGWSSSITSGYANVRTYDASGTTIQYYVNGTENKTTITSPGYGGNGEDAIIIEWKMKRQNPSDLYFDFSFTDKDGAEIAFLKLDRNSTSVSGEYYMGYPAEGTDCAIVATNNDDGTTHKVEYYVAGTVVSTIASKEGKVNGFGGITSTNGRWSTSWNHIGFGDLTIASYTAPAAAVDVTATYTVNGTTIKTVTKTYDSSAATGASFDAVYYSVNGENVLYKADATTLSESATIALTAVENWGNLSVGDAVSANSVPYVVKSKNLVPNGNFEHGMNGWYNRANTTPPTNYSITTSDKPASAERAAVSSGNGGASSTNSIKTGWKLTVGDTYYYSIWVKAGDGWHGLGESSSPTTESQSIVANNGFGTSGSWVQKTGVFTATQDYLVFFEGWSSVGVADVELYKVEVDESKIANTTIKFVSSADNTEIKDAVTVKGIVGDVITISDYATATITYGGNPYSLDSTNPTTYTVVGNNDVVTLTYTTDAYTHFTADSVKVIYGNKPIMPTTVTAVTGTGATTVATGAVWTGYENLAVGTHTVNGTVSVDGVTVNGTTTVTVLDETFSLADTDVPASNDKTLTFPESISGEFAIEFDYTPSNVQNNWIYISADGALWGAGQVGLGTDNDQGGHLKAQPSTYLGYVESGKTYRVLVTASAETDTYSVVVTSEDGTQWKADSTFRAGSDYINSIRMTPNGNTGAFSVKNIKVYNANTSLKTITINATGSVSETTTVKATSAEVAPIPYCEGNIMKSRSISGNTVTLVYEETYTGTGSWYMRNNFTDDNWLSQSKYIGSHNAFADKDDVFDNEGGDLYGDTGATSSSSVVINNSRTQTADALEQLNAGVRYFDVRLSRQKDGTFAAVHGPAFENFRDVAVTIAQWAKENPGEVIIMDFQTVRDALYTSPLTSTSGDAYNGENKGDDNAAVYAALVELFKDTGLTDYMTTNWDQKYGAITNSGTKTVILPFGKARAVNNQGGYFINRSALHNDVTYTESSSYSTIVDYLDDNYASLSDGATICTIHAYTTPTSLSSSNSLINAAKTNNTKWINESNFEAWMGYGKGDVLLMNNTTSNITPYYEKLSSFNRTGSSYSYSGNFVRTDNGVTIDAAQANVPYSTRFTVNAASSEQSVVVDGKTCTTKNAYSIKLMQFDRDSVQPTGNVTLTFPKASTDNTTVDVLIYNNAIVATANVGEAISYETSTLGNYVVATMAAPGVTMTVNYVDGDDTLYSETKEFAYGTTVYSVPAGDFYVVLGGKAYILNSESAQSYTASESDTEGKILTVNVNVISRYAVLEDALISDDLEVWGINATNENSIFVAANSEPRMGPAYDADGVAVTDGTHTPSTLGGNRNGYLQFPVVDLADGKAAIAKFYVRTWHGNTFANENTTIRLSATAINDDSWTTLTDGAGYDDTKAPKFTGYTSVMFSSVATQNEGYITFDVTEMMKAAKNAGLETITMRLATAWGAAYIVEREAAVAGGSYQGKAAYIDVVDANTVTVTGATKVTKNGTDVTAFANDLVVPTDAAIRVYSDEAYVTDDTNVYTAGSAIATSDGAEYHPASLGVTVVNGAQVRIGGGVDENGKVAEGSGLRFIGMVERDNTLVGIPNAEIGVKITAEGSDQELVIRAEKFQDDAETVFTAALTNLNVGNYNRKFTATGYVKIGDNVFTGNSATRSIYQVSAGLLAKDSTDGTEYDEGALADGSRLYDVLNAYVNQTGIRLQINENKDGLEVYNKENSTNNYSGEVFFEITNTTCENDVYTVTIKPVGEKTEIKGYWNEYIRVNNNNSAVKSYTTMADNYDGTYTITFDLAAYKAAN